MKQRNELLLTLALLAASASMWALTGCSGADQTDVDPTLDPTYLQEHPDEVIVFDDLPDGDGTLMEDEIMRLAEHDPDGAIGAAHQAFKNCWTGPGFAARLDGLGSDNVPTIFGPCYQGTDPAGHDCIFPSWNTGLTVPYEFNLSLDNVYCTVGMLGHPESPGISIIGNSEFFDAGNAWKAATGVNFVQKSASTGPAAVSMMCAPPTYQINNPTELAAATPWGPLQLNGKPALFTNPAGAQFSLSTPYTIQNPQAKLFYGLGAMWINDITINAKINTCGGTALQRLNKSKALAYRIALHEFGHIFGFNHTAGGIMKKDTVCADLGDGSSSTSPRPSLPAAYATIYKLYADNVIFNAVPSNWFPDNSTCSQLAAPILGTQDNEMREGNDLN